MEDHDPDDERIRQAETEDLRKALQHAVLKIVLHEDRCHKTRTSMNAISALTELTFQYAINALVPDLYAFSTHANRKSSVTPDDVALVLRKLPTRQLNAFKAEFCRGVTGNNAVDNLNNNNTNRSRRASDASINLPMKRGQSKGSLLDSKDETNNVPPARRRNRSEVELSLSSSSSSSSEDEAMDAGRRNSTPAKAKRVTNSVRAASIKSTSHIRSLNSSKTEEQREALLSKFGLPGSEPSFSDEESSQTPSSRRVGERAVAESTAAVRRPISSLVRSPESAFPKKRQSTAPLNDSLLQDSSDENHKFDRKNDGGPVIAVVTSKADVGREGSTGTKSGKHGNRSVELFDKGLFVNVDSKNMPSPGFNKNHAGSSNGLSRNEKKHTRGGTDKELSYVAGHPKHSQVALTLANLSDSGMSSETSEAYNDGGQEEDNEIIIEAEDRIQKPDQQDKQFDARRARRPAIESDEDD